MAPVLVGGLLAGLLAGCTSDDAEVAPTPVVSSDDDAAPAPSPEPAVEALPRGPLDQLLDLVDQRSVESPEAQLARLERFEELVAACMAEEGFEYVPKDWREGGTLPEAAEESAGHAIAGDLRIAAAARYGYGISTQSRFETPEPTGGVGTDPNADRVAAMSDAERRAWDLALTGPGQGEESASGQEPYDWTRHGCVGRAAHEQDAERPEEAARRDFDDAAWSDLRDAIGALEESVPDDPRLAEVSARWSGCMNDAGYPGYAEPRDAVDDVIGRAMRITDEVGAAGIDVTTDDYLTDPAYLAQQAEIARLEAELATVEIAIATADVTCQVENDYERHYVETWIALQEEFYDEHRADLEAWLGAFEEFQAAEG